MPDNSREYYENLLADAMKSRGGEEHDDLPEALNPRGAPQEPLRHNAVSRALKDTRPEDDEVDTAYRWLKANHPDIHDFLVHKAPMPIDPVMTAATVRNFGPNRFMSMAKHAIRQDTEKLYSPDYPHLKEDINSMMANLLSQLDESFLLEHDEEITWQKYGDAIKKKMIEQDIHPEDSDQHRPTFEAAIKDADPTPHQEYGAWLARLYSKPDGIRHFEDIGGRAKEALSKFHEAKIRRKLKAHNINPDIGSYKQLTHLEDAVDKLPAEQHHEVDVSESDAPKVKDEHWTQIIPKTHAAACKYGAGSRWCTTGKDGGFYRSYTSDGSHLHIFIPRNAKTDASGRQEKYQLHFPSNQFMDENDAPVEPSKIFGADRPLSSAHREMLRPSVEHAIKNNNREGIPRLVPYFMDKETADLWHKDPSEHLRAAAALAGHREHLDKLVNDPSSKVRAAVASHNHLDLLEKLANDPSAEVKKNVATHNHKHLLDKLANDPSAEVRLNVLNHGHSDHIDAVLAAFDKH